MKIVIKTQSDKKKTVTLTAITFVSLLAFYLIATFVPAVAGAVEFIAFLFFVFAAYVLSRFTLTRFEYVLTDEELVIYKWIGEKSTKVCHITTSMIEKAYSKEEWKKNKKIEQITGMYNYNASFLPNYYIVVVYEYCTARAAVTFSGDENMKKAIDALLESQENH